MFARKFFFITVLLTCYGVGYAVSAQEGFWDPWMTGPLLASSGSVVPPGHSDYEPYLFVTDDYGVYTNRWHSHAIPNTDKISPTMLYMYGLAKRFDFEAIVPYHFIIREDQSDNEFGDTNLQLGFQAIDVSSHSKWPQLRIVLGELFPSGKYNNRSATRLGTDIGGMGSYQTSLSFNFQKYTWFSNSRVLRSRFSIQYTVPSDVNVIGFNSFGGGFNTRGTVSPGNVLATDLAFEYSYRHHWVPGLDITYTYVDKSTFRGQPGVDTKGKPAKVGTGVQEVIALAPALEYNFNANVGVIAGVWFSVYGKNTDEFVSYVAALNVYV